ncbi:MAG TPA: methyltransferase domain-containing protein [Acidimicrobiales bacterium]|nr:methyltransferase domain-containing protein [Acidimicrobiales bacterium]
MTTDKRQHVHGMWAAVADRWVQNADYVERRAGGINKALLDGAEIGPSDRVLELACGPGGLALAAAAVASEVVASDVALAMVEAAAARAIDAGVSNFTAKVLDLEAIAEPDSSFDAVLVREGLMFAVDPAAAVAEIARVLKPGGRAAASVWGPKADNPWLAIVLDSVAAQLGFEVPPPGMPGPFSLADGERFAGLFRDAGFTDVELTTAAAPLHADSLEEWWLRTSSLAGPVAGIIATLPSSVKGDLDQRVREAALPYLSADGIDFPGLTLVVTART